MMIDEIQLLLDLFQDSVPDKESNRLVWKLCEEKHRWIKGNGLFSTIRDRNLKAARNDDLVKESQYCFEEVIAKTLYNMNRPQAAFDPDSPYWIIKNAFILAKHLDIDSQKVIDIIR